MLRGVDRLKLEVARLLGGPATVITGPDGRPVEARAGDELRVLYDGEPRHVAVLRVEPWGLRVRDLDRHGVRSFRFEKIGVGPESDA